LNGFERMHGVGVLTCYRSKDYARGKPEGTRESLQSTTGVDIGDPAGPYYFIKRLSADWSDRDQWDRLADWIYDTANQYEQALREVMRQGGEETIR
jgi:hypothetical protein